MRAIYLIKLGDFWIFFQVSFRGSFLFDVFCMSIKFTLLEIELFNQRGECRQYRAEH